ncbi:MULTISPECIES: metal-dependent hydrolase family protein [Paracoccus]|uniref:Imidazolonepropionase-like amidohydrolase n=1 Tax=Paracoccus versutus TaxID=34007 RepID=A0A3D9XS07_PARVE|nr:MULTISPECIES: amidohydrolase family protein [Paracoccus]REF73185.1 imidazolonepropionase-like amidohydrolase [Paracoccus versutus]WGR54917.1 amidohydrolase family protein [Paracoccus versutus]
MTTTLLKNASILDVDAGSLSATCDVLIAEGRIAEIGSRAMTAERVIDLKGRTLMPGLCDAHVHVIVPMNSFALLTKWSPFYTAIRAMPILRDMLMRGFTTVRDAGGADFGLARAVEEDLIPSPRILYSGKALSQSGGHGDMRGPGETAHDDHYYVPSLGRICNGVAEVRAAVRDEIRRGAHQVKLMVGGGIASYTDPIHYVQFSREEIRAAVEEAGNASTYVMAHAYTNRCIRHAVECGVRSIEHGNFLDDETAALMRESGAYLVPTLSAYTTMWEEGLQVGMPAELHAKIRPVLDAGPRQLEIAARHGVPMVYGTDLIGPLHRHQSLEFRIRGEVLPAAEVIRQATCNAAALFNMQDQIGRVKEGLRADLIALRGNPLEDLGLLQAPENLSLIMKDGRIYREAA